MDQLPAFGEVAIDRPKGMGLDREIFRSPTMITPCDTSLSAQVSAPIKSFR
jgi:hypothetical protein